MTEAIPNNSINSRSKKGKLKTILKFTSAVFLVFNLYSVVILILFRWFPLSSTAFIENERASEVMNLFSESGIEYEWVSFDKLSDHVKVAVISSEDQKFKSHFGFDVEAIEDAIDEMNRGKRVRGASTITQQVAKNLFLWNTKSFVRKGIEFYYTVLIEILWSKKRILEVYLNTAEFGKGVYGVQAASEKYFHKGARALNKGEAALLAAVLPNPKRYSVRNPSPYILKRKGKILRQMELIGGTSVLKDF